MAEDKATQSAGGGGGDGPSKKCPDCPPPGLPSWMATFSDMVTLLLTFFVLLLSFAKTETAKYEAALGSIRNAFGGNVLEHGEVIERGKSPDNKPVMMDSPDIIKPFPIEFLTSEGLLKQLEINRESDEVLEFMRRDLAEFDLSDFVDVYETMEGIKVRFKDPIFFEQGLTSISQASTEVLVKLIKLLTKRDWTLFVEGHASRGEIEKTTGNDAFYLSAMRAIGASKYLIKKGVRPDKITTVFYGDSRPDPLSGEGKESLNRRVEFLLQKTDLKTPGHKVPSK